MEQKRPDQESSATWEIAAEEVPEEVTEDTTLLDRTFVDFLLGRHCGSVE
jgi:hypothetical protein